MHDLATWGQRLFAEKVMRVFVRLSEAGPYIRLSSRTHHRLSGVISHKLTSNKNVAVSSLSSLS